MAAVPSGFSNTMRSGAQTSEVTDLRISLTHSLVPGVRLPDPAAFSSVNFTLPAGTATALPQTEDTRLFHGKAKSGEWPVVLLKNEGILVRLTTPAANYQATVTLRWEERWDYPGAFSTRTP